jgi:chitosanase
MNEITAEIKKKIESIVTVFENGKLSAANYGAMTVLQDGKEVRGVKTFQITYGVQQTTEQGNLAELIKMYVNTKGAKYATQLEAFVPIIGVKPLVHNESFKRVLIAAGDDPAMQTAQDLFFDLRYWKPAKAFFDRSGFTLPLSMLVIYDSTIHSGSNWNGDILMFLRNQFKEAIPSNGGNEQKWVAEYVRVRDKWLEFHKNRILQRTDYRTDCLLEQIKTSNWNLAKPVKILDGRGRVMEIVD